MEDGTIIPLAGKWSGSIFESRYNLGFKFDIETNTAAMKLLESKKHHIITITCELTDVTTEYPKCWNMSVKEEE